MKLCVILVNYNTPSDTIDCLESLKACHIPGDLSLKTIVVDNASIDDSTDILSLKYPEVELIRSYRNLGFAGGNNLGIKAGLKTDPSHILLLNNDTVVPQEFFDKIYQSAINDDKVGLLTPKIYFAKGYEFKDHYKTSELGKVVWAAGGVMDWDNLLGSNANVDEVDEGQFKNVVDTDFATGACLLVRREVIDKIGLLNENYFLYLEDVEFSERAKRAGFRVVFDPSISLWHKVSQSSGIGSHLNDYFITRNRLVFGLTYARFRTKFALLREAVRKLSTGTPAQKTAIKDFFLHRLGKGTYLK